MGVRVAVIGNGPSYALYNLVKENAKYDVVIGCNIPPVDVDYAVIMDEKALIECVRTHKTYEKHQYVLGPRAVRANDVARFKPAHPLGLVEGVKEEGKLAATLVEPEGIQSRWNRNGYFSSGHAAFQYAIMCRPDVDEIHMYGFDSLFTSKQDTYTDKAMYNKPEWIDNPEKRHISPPVWQGIWSYILHDLGWADNIEVYFPCYQYDIPVDPAMFIKNVGIIQFDVSRPVRVE